jgi:hypothetical protein
MPPFGCDDASFHTRQRVLQALTRLASKDTHAGGRDDIEKIVRVSSSRRDKRDD